MAYHVVNRWVDTLILNIKGKLSEDVADELHQYQMQAREQEQDIPTAWEFLGRPLMIMPNGAGKAWRWIVYNDDLHLLFGKGKLNGNICKLTVRSVYLHSQDLGVLLNQVYRFLVDFLGFEPDWQVSEVHQCADIAGWQLTSDDEPCFVSRGSCHKLPEEEVSVQPETTGRGRKVRAFYFSKTAPHSCCIYNKTREVKVHHKEWFYEVWRKNGWDGETVVTRIEFRYDRECLREMKVEDPFDMLDQLDSMWAYSTQNWLRHTQPDGDTNQSRWETSTVWQVVQASAMYYTDVEPATRPKKVELDAERLMMGFVGNATSWAARLVLLYETMRRAEAEGMQLDVSDGVPETVIGEDGAGFLSWAYEPMQDYLTERKRATFYGVTRLKLKRLGRQLKLTA